MQSTKNPILIDTQNAVDRRPSGRLTWIARHMGITLATYYRYRSGRWPKPLDFESRESAAIAAWDAHSATATDWRDQHPRKRATPAPKAESAA
jgi:hypothetical protein